MRDLLHDIRNHLAVAVANVEAFRDGVVAPTPARFTLVLDELRAVDDLLGRLAQSEPPR
jgi:hypothetical protein